MQVRCIKVLPFLPKTTKSPPNWYFKGDFRELHWLCISREPLPGNPVECTPVMILKSWIYPPNPGPLFQWFQDRKCRKVIYKLVCSDINMYLGNWKITTIYIYIKYPKSEWRSSFWSEVCNKFSSKRVPCSRKTRAAEIFFCWWHGSFRTSSQAHDSQEKVGSNFTEGWQQKETFPWHSTWGYLGHVFFPRNALSSQSFLESCRESCLVLSCPFFSFLVLGFSAALSIECQFSSMFFGLFMWTFFSRICSGFSHLKATFFLKVFSSRSFCGFLIWSLFFQDFLKFSDLKIVAWQWFGSWWRTWLRMWFSCMFFIS